MPQQFTEDQTLSIIPVFKIKQGSTMADCRPFLDECARLVKENEPDCYQYAVVIDKNDDRRFALRELYKNGDALLYHMSVVGETLQKLAEHSDVVDMNIYGKKEELEKLMPTLGRFQPKLWELQSGGVSSLP